jgi:hypothetical protein
MTGFGWDALAVALAAGLGVGFIAVTALGRRRKTSPADPAHGPAGGPRRIDVVAIDEPVRRSPE